MLVCERYEEPTLTLCKTHTPTQATGAHSVARSLSYNYALLPHVGL